MCDMDESNRYLMYCVLRGNARTFVLNFTKRVRPADADLLHKAFVSQLSEQDEDAYRVLDVLCRSEKPFPITNVLSSMTLVLDVSFIRNVPAFSVLFSLLSPSAKQEAPEPLSN